MSFLKPSLAAATPNLIPDVDDLPGWTGYVTIAAILGACIEETTYRSAYMTPGSQWFNSKAAPLAAVGAYGCAAGAAACYSCGWYTKGFKFISETEACTGYVIGAHRAAPYDPILPATRAATLPFEAAKGNAEATGSA